MSNEKDIYGKLVTLENDIKTIKTILLLSNSDLMEKEFEKICSANDIKLIWFALNGKKAISEWLKSNGLEKLKKIFYDNFNEPFLYLLYEKSDGTKTTRELAEELPISHSTIATYWDRWTELGIMEKISVQRGERGKKIFSLSEIGINISK